jgi:L-ascorbate metabolism protein UlaG (beta-lactamase superfamily)
MRIVSLNPDPGFGGSAWLVELEGHKLLIDPGVAPRRGWREGFPRYDLMLFRVAEITEVGGPLVHA